MKIRRFIKVILLLAVCLPLSAGETSPRGDRKDIEVVSIIGDRFTTVSLGSTIFQKEISVTKVSPWKLDSFVETAIKDALGNNEKIRFVNTRIKREYLTDIYDLSEQGFLEDRDYDFDQITDALSFFQRKKVDTLVLVIAHEIEDPIRGASTMFKGYGMYRNASFFTRHYLYAYFRVLVIDVARREIQYDQSITDYQELDKQHWAARLNQLASADRQLIYSTLKRMLAGRMADVLVDAGMLDKETAQREKTMVNKRVQPRVSVTGGDYTEAVGQVYLTLDMQRIFKHYAWRSVRRETGIRDNNVLYADVVDDWVDKHFNWEKLRGRLVLFYTRLDLSVDELNAIAKLNENRGHRKSPLPTREEIKQMSGIWQQTASREAMADLLAAINARQQLIRREARGRQLPR